jgi:hypothetical protein
MPEDAKSRQGPVETAFATSAIGNSTAFGFSITITVTFGVTEHFAGSPSLVELLIYGVAAALALGLIEGMATRGFRVRIGPAPTEVMMLGTALNVLSVAAAVGAAMLCGKLVDGTPTWPIASFTATAVYVLAESLETLAAEGLQQLRGDPDADEQRT